MDRKALTYHQLEQYSQENVFCLKNLDIDNILIFQ